MPRRLSFIVFGVPRSGTKALARGLNLHPNVLCALERFDHRVDHSRLFFPESFLDAPRLMPQAQLGKLRELRAEASRKPDVVHPGNKFPRYYLALGRINSEVPGLRNVFIYRSPYGFMPSWNRKEAAREARWNAGQVGLFGFLELLVCLQQAMRQPEVFVFPYSRGLNESAEPLEAALDFIGADPAGFDAHTFAAAHMPRKVTSERRWALAPHEQEFLDRLWVRDLDDLVARSWGPMTPALTKQLEDYMGAIAPLLADAIDEAMAAYENPATAAYGARFTAANREVLAELLELSRPSTFMADLQQGGIGRRLNWVYHQRARLRRRVTSLRKTPAP